MTENHQTIELVPDGPILPVGIRFIRGAYWFFVAGGLLLFVAMIAGLESANKISVAETSFGLTIYILILYGIHKRKNWLVSLILFYSSWTLISSFIRVVGDAPVDSTMLKQKIGAFLIALFSIYQIYIFRRRDTKQFFSEKGQTLY
jgi:hypothetical protein